LRSRIGNAISREVVRGSIRFDGRELMACRAAELRRIRGKEIGLVLQSPVAALNPALRIETQLREVWRAHEAAPWQRQAWRLGAAGAHGAAGRRGVRGGIRGS